MPGEILPLAISKVRQGVVAVGPVLPDVAVTLETVKGRWFNRVKATAQGTGEFAGDPHTVSVTRFTEGRARRGLNKLLASHGFRIADQPDPDGSHPVIDDSHRVRVDARLENFAQLAARGDATGLSDYGVYLSVAGEVVDLTLVGKAEAVTSTDVARLAAQRIDQRDGVLSFGERSARRGRAEATSSR
jgi:hypothetical protein